jgi:hypothetical protein
MAGCPHHPDGYLDEEGVLMVLTVIRRTAAASVLAAGAVAGVLPGAPADAASCPIGAACVWSGPAETGAMATLPGGFGCRTASALGLPSVQSAVNNAVEQTILLYADSRCSTPASPAFVVRQVDQVTPPALSVRIRPLP